MNTTTWDDGLPQEHRFQHHPISRFFRYVAELKGAGKPPFDPLKAGWVMCACRCHLSEWITMDHRHDQCPSCDGLGIAVGPPEDGLEIAVLTRKDFHPGCDPLTKQPKIMALIDQANAFRAKSHVERN
jgi:hypothetical protein